MAHVVRERDNGRLCFSTVRLDSGEQVMVSIAQGDVKIIKMNWGGFLPGETLWHSNNADEIAAVFFDRELPNERPLVSIRNAVLRCQCCEDVRAF